jgi:hypothetical protein
LLARSTRSHFVAHACGERILDEKIDNIASSPSSAREISSRVRAQKSTRTLSMLQRRDLSLPSRQQGA